MLSNYVITIAKGVMIVSTTKKSTRTKEATLGQKVLFGCMIFVTLPWSLIYLLVWSGRCAYCGKRILFNKRVCKKCFTNSHAIVEQFDEKIEMFYQQLSTVDDITDIISQYHYVVNQFEGIQDIYKALDDEVDIESMEQKTLVTLHRTLENWMNNCQYQFSINEAYRKETLEEIKDLQEDMPYFKEILQPYYDEISEIKPENTSETLENSVQTEV